MTRLKAFIGRHPVASYFGLTFVNSWGGALLAIGGSGAMRGTTRSGFPEQTSWSFPSRSPLPCEPSLS